MESLHYDPLTKQPYDLTVHVPHIVPCCGETCAITTIHHAKSTTSKCPFCAEALPDAGWIINKLVCRMLSAQAQPKAPDHDSKSLLRLRNSCSVHRDQNTSMICIDDNMLLCPKCVSETSRHVGHQVEDLSQCVQLLTTELAKVKPKMDALRTRCEQGLKKVYKEVTIQLQAKLDEQIAESERVLEQLLLFNAPGHSSPTLSIKDAQALCRNLQGIDIEKKAARLEKEMRVGMERWLKKELQCMRVRQDPIGGPTAGPIGGPRGNFPPAGNVQRGPPGGFNNQPGPDSFPKPLGGPIHGGMPAPIKVGFAGPPVHGGPGFPPKNGIPNMTPTKEEPKEKGEIPSHFDPIIETVARGLEMLDGIDQRNPKKKQEMDQKMQTLFEILASGTMKPVTLNDLKYLCQALDQNNISSALTLQQKIAREDYTANKDWLYVMRRIVQKK